MMRDFLRNLLEFSVLLAFIAVTAWLLTPPLPLPV